MARSLATLTGALLVCAAAAGGARAQARDTTPVLPGVVVDQVIPGSRWADAGLRAGDVLLGWRWLGDEVAACCGIAGVLTGVFDWTYVVTEIAPRAAIELTGERDGGRFTVGLGAAEEGITVRPRLTAVLEAADREARRLARAGRASEAASRWNLLTAAAADPALTVALHFTIGGEWLAAGQPRRAVSAYEAGLREVDAPAARVAVLGAASEACRRAQQWDAAFAYGEHAHRLAELVFGASLITARAARELGLLALARGDLDEAERRLEAALALEQVLAPGSSLVARSQQGLGDAALERGELGAAEAHYERALAVSRELSPEGLDTAGALNGLGRVAFERGELDGAELHFRDSLALRRLHAPRSPGVAATLNNIGLVAYDRGDLRTAEEHFMEARGLIEQREPASPRLAPILTNLGNIAGDRGDLGRAAAYYQEALDLEQKLAPDGIGVAASLDNLGLVALDRNELDRAGELTQRALRIQRRHAPDSLDTALSLTNLGMISAARGDLERAERELSQALALQRGLAPGSLELATTLDDLGVVARRRGLLELATARHAEALRIRTAVAPGSLHEADSLAGLGEIAFARGDLAQAADHIGRALAIRERLAPMSAEVAAALRALGDVHRRRGDPTAAAVAYGQALGALDAQVGRLGGSLDVGSMFRASFAQLYRAHLEVLLELGRREDAFFALERSRARGLLAAWSERELAWRGDDAERLQQGISRLEGDYLAAQHRLRDLHTVDDAAEIDRSLLLLARLRRERDRLVGELRRASPEVAGVRYPEPASWQAVRAALAPGTLLVSYAVDDASTRLFVIAPDEPLAVHTIALGARSLATAVAGFREQIARFRGGARREVLGETALRLYQSVLGPIDDRVGRSRRLVVVPDGALQGLPFAALARSRGAGAGWGYLVESLPVTVVPSATLLVELVSARAPELQAASSYVAFADPAAGAGAPGRASSSAVAAAALPSARLEVQRFAESVAAQAEVYVGADATEGRVKARASDARYLHLATHAALDAAHPLESALLLAADAREDGRLYAWEVVQQLRLRAELVVLSGCGTGAGRSLEGEGVLSLARAFHAAGARSVVASLWPVPDEPTAELMARFYGHLRAGRPKDEALAAAQRELGAEPGVTAGARTTRDLSAPYYWAAFQLGGDWR